MKLGPELVLVDEPVGWKRGAGRREIRRQLDDVAVAGSKAALQNLPDSIFLVSGDVGGCDDLAAILGRVVLDVDGGRGSSHPFRGQTLESPLQGPGKIFGLWTVAHAAHHLSHRFSLKMAQTLKTKKSLLVVFCFC